MRHRPLLACLACYAFIFLVSCTKDVANDLPANAITKATPKAPIKTPVIAQSGTSARYPTDLALVELTNNGDGSWTGYLGGMAVRFSDFMYEIDYDINGNPLPPEEGQPAWPQSIGPEPGVTTPQQFNCLTFITYPNSPDNQVSVQNHCVYQGTLYSMGAGMNNYFNTLYANWSNYMDALYAWNTPGNPGYNQGPRPTQPSSPSILPYIQQDSYQTGATTQVFAARFGVYSYNPSTGITFGMDAQ